MTDGVKNARYGLKDDYINTCSQGTYWKKFVTIPASILTTKVSSTYTMLYFGLKMCSKLCTSNMNGVKKKFQKY